MFKTLKGSPDAVHIVGVGVLGSYGRGGVTVAHAAETMPELQEQDDEGNLVPLTGSKLVSAAKRFAEAQNLELVNLNEKEVDQLPLQLGSIPDRPPAHEVAEAEYNLAFGPESASPASERQAPPPQAVPAELTPGGKS